MAKTSLVRSLIQQFQDWAVESGTLRSNRKWCLFGLTFPITRESLANLFTSKDLVAKFEERYKEKDPSKVKPISYVQAEINLLYGFQKAMTVRHKTRLQIYRDDAAQKVYHCRRAVTSAFEQFSLFSDAAEE